MGVTTPLVGREINLLAHDQHVKGGGRVIKIPACFSGHWDERHLSRHKLSEHCAKCSDTGKLEVHGPEDSIDERGCGLALLIVVSEVAPYTLPCEHPFELSQMTSETAKGSFFLDVEAVLSCTHL